MEERNMKEDGLFSFLSNQNLNVAEGKGWPVHKQPIIA